MRTTPHKLVWSALLLGALCYVLASSLLVSSFSQGPNNRNVSIDTRVNITQSQPEILEITVEGTNITLNAGSSRVLSCNVSVRDYNGGTDILSANATFFHNATSSHGAADDNNTHYTNSTPGNCSIIDTNGFYRNFTCSFPVQYYANVGYWACNVTVIDAYGFTDWALNYTFIDPLLALNVTTLIDYGDLAVGDTSNVQQANVTNLGNRNINISVEGYGRTIGDGLSFNCTVGNISVEYQKYNISDGGQTLGFYRNLSSSQVQIPGLTVAQQTADNESSLNATYWILFVPPNPFGLCNGTIIFQAESST